MDMEEWNYKIAKEMSANTEKSYQLFITYI